MTIHPLELLYEALALPPGAEVSQRVAKGLLGERGGLSPPDRRVVEQGIERLTWRATLKPGTVGLAAYRADDRDYSQIVVMVGELREEAKVGRVLELVHRAVAHPLVLVCGGASGASLSVGIKRVHERESDRVVVERLAQSPNITGGKDPLECAFLSSIALAAVAAGNLWSLHQGWGERCEAFEAARIAGRYRLPTNEAEAEGRRAALAAHVAQAREVFRLRKAAASEPRLNRRIELSREVARAEADLAQLSNLLA